MSDMPQEYDDRDHEQAMVMPFTAVASVGGPYDDLAFAAGWDCGRIWGLLSSRTIAAMTETVRTPLVQQVDAIAMRHGYTTQVLQAWDDWTHVGFTRAAVGPYEL